MTLWNPSSRLQDALSKKKQPGYLRVESLCVKGVGFNALEQEDFHVSWS